MTRLSGNSPSAVTDLGAPRPLAERADPTYWPALVRPVELAGDVNSLGGLTAVGLSDIPLNNASASRPTGCVRWVGGLAPGSGLVPTIAAFMGGSRVEGLHPIPARRRRPDAGFMTRKARCQPGCRLGHRRHEEGGGGRQSWVSRQRFKLGAASGRTFYLVS